MIILNTESYEKNNSIRAIRLSHPAIRHDRSRGCGTKSPRQRTNVCIRETLRGQETSPPYRKENKERDPHDRRRHEPYAHVFRLDRQPGQALAGQLPIHRPLENLLRQPPHHRLRSRRYRRYLSPMGRYARRLLLPQYGSRRRGRDRSGLRELWRRLRIRRRLQAIREPCGRSRFVQGIKGERLPNSP